MTATTTPGQPTVTAASQAVVLQDILRSESQALLRYVGEADPYTENEAQRRALAEVLEMAADEQNEIGMLARFMMRKRIMVPIAAPYPMYYTTMNYIALAHLLPLLAEHTQEAIGHLETALKHLGNHEASQLVENILNLKKKHRDAFTKLAETCAPGQPA